MIASHTAFHSAHPFIFALVSPGPSPELGDFAQVYAPFIGTWNVNAVGYLCGFKSPHHFSHAFKVKTGLSPIEFRNT